jgi:phosphocarrier protein HPr/phosphocarrier protein
VEVFDNGKTANLKSIISIMSMGLRKGSEVTLRIHGEDEGNFIEELSEFIAKLEG